MNLMDSYYYFGIREISRVEVVLPELVDGYAVIHQFREHYPAGNLTGKQFFMGLSP